MDVARTIGLDLVTGTIDEKVVLSALAELAENDPENDDLIREAAVRVQGARSAGVEEPDAGSRLIGRKETTTQLRYRSEMADVFTDLAIDVGLRHPSRLATVA